MMTDRLDQYDPAFQAWAQRWRRQAQALYSPQPPAPVSVSPHWHLCPLCQAVWAHAAAHCPAGEACACQGCYAGAKQAAGEGTALRDDMARVDHCTS
jgi:hypothetical protein